MKKFSEDDFWSMSRYAGGITNAHLLDQIMKNQNEIIDWIEKTTQKYPDWAKEQVKLGDRSTKIGGNER